MIKLLRSYIKYCVAIVFFFLLVALFLFPKASFASGTYCAETYIPDVDCGSFYNRTPSNNPCKTELFYLETCEPNYNPFDTRYTGDQCVPQKWPGSYCMGCDYGLFHWEGLYCISTIPPTPTPIITPTPTPTPTPTITPTPPPVCDTIDTDGLGWDETCIGPGGPIKDACNNTTTPSSYKYAICHENTTGGRCEYGSDFLCDPGETCTVESNGHPTCVSTCAAAGGTCQSAGNCDLEDNTSLAGTDCAASNKICCIPLSCTDYYHGRCTNNGGCNANEESKGQADCDAGESCCAPAPTQPPSGGICNLPYGFPPYCDTGIQCGKPGACTWSPPHSNCPGDYACSTDPNPCVAPTGAPDACGIISGAKQCWFSELSYEGPYEDGTCLVAFGGPDMHTCTLNVSCAAGKVCVSGKCITAPNSISGVVFSDTDRDGTWDGVITEPIFPGVTASISPGTSSDSDGSYSFTSLLDNQQYIVSFSGLPSGYSFTYPLTLGNSLSVTVGPNCSVLSGHGASCSGTNVINLNAGVTNGMSAWIQSVGSDMRWDSGFNDPLPSSGTYASISGIGGMPGIIFSGASTPIFGLGQASASLFNWQVGGPLNRREVFTDTHSLIPTSYRFLLETAEGSVITPVVNLTAPTNYCGTGGIDNCTLNSSLPHGIYLANGDLTLSAANYTFPGAPSSVCPDSPAPCNFIILVDGNLTINGKIIVPIGSTAIFSVKGNITVNGAVGETVASTTCNIASHIGCSIEGLYSADNNFYTTDVSSINNCTGASDKRLNIAGTVVANAGRNNGSFINKRSLCNGNTSYPSVSFIERPDFILNYPSMVKKIPRDWREVPA